ncbi:hypothetical protein BVRB_3g054730 [Beta vulgaris subsp. vulgaris]|nr:hypothetical protein BVRB_3g054730 [Beta vulgaris subsp. vulgaris]
MGYSFSKVAFLFCFVVAVALLISIEVSGQNSDDNYNSVRQSAPYSAGQGGHSRRRGRNAIYPGKG